MKNKLFYLLCVSLSMFFVGAKDSFAEIHELELQGVVCSKEKYTQDDYYEVFEACRADYLEGKINEYIVGNLDIINPGDLVIFVEKYHYGGISEVNAFSMRINYDPRYWRNSDYNGEEEFLSYYNLEDYPKTKRAKKWSNISISNYKPGVVLINGSGGRSYPLDKSINLSMFGLILREDVPAGTKLPIYFEDEYNQALKLIPSDIERFPFATKNIILRASGSDNYLNEIVTNNYTIKREENQPPVVIGAEPKTTIAEFISNFENDDGFLRVFDSDGNEIYDFDRYIKSYMKIKFIDLDEVKDELTVVVKGDLDGNGIVDMVDYLYTINVILKNLSDDYLRMQIGDIDNNGIINSTDSTSIVSYVIESLDSLNR